MTLSATRIFSVCPHLSLSGRIDIRPPVTVVEEAKPFVVISIYSTFRTLLNQEPILDINGLGESEKNFR